MKGRSGRLVTGGLPKLVRDRFRENRKGPSRARLRSVLGKLVFPSLKSQTERKSPARQDKIFHGLQPNSDIRSFLFAGDSRYIVSRSAHPISTRFYTRSAIPWPYAIVEGFFASHGHVFTRGQTADLLSSNVC